MSEAARSIDRAALDVELVKRFGLRKFIELAWHVPEPVKTRRWGWCMDAIADHLQAVSDQEINRLLINVPPGMMKSLQVGVFWPTYEWTFARNTSFIGTSYNVDHAARDCRKMRDIVMSTWFQERWPLKMTKAGEARIDNAELGWRDSVPFTSLTGERADRVIVDDPHSVETAESDAERKRVLRNVQESLPSRVNVPGSMENAIVMVMQRLHSLDASTKYLETFPDVVHLCLPMEFEPHRRCVTVLGFEDPRTEEGELLFPERYDRETVEDMKEGMGEYAIAGQFQQRPAPREGGLVKRQYFARRYKERTPNPLNVVQSWDCASKEKTTNDPSAKGTFAIFHDHIELWDVTVDRNTYPELLQRVKDEYAEVKPRPSVVLIEDKDSGVQVIQTLTHDRECLIPVKAMNPGKLDKYTRMEVETPILERGIMWLPEDAPWVAAFLAEVTNFPNAAHDDQVDFLSQFLKWYRENPIVVTDDEETDMGEDAELAAVSADAPWNMGR